jgi:hypothetical protein
MRAGFPGEVPNCAHPAFEAADGTAYTEVHHIQPLSEGGVDIPTTWPVSIAPPGSAPRPVRLGVDGDATQPGYR